MSRLGSIESSLMEVNRRHKEKFESASSESFFSGWYGWEKWLQVELAFELSKKGEVHVEKPYAYSKAKKVPASRLGNSNAFIDIIYREKNHLKEYYSAIEITLGRSPQKLKKVLSDFIRVRALKNGEWNFRSVYAIMIFDINGDANDKYKGLFDEIKSRYEFRSLVVGDFEFLIFGWGSNGIVSNMVNKKYREWLAGLIEIYKSNGVTLPVAKRALVEN